MCTQSGSSHRIAILAWLLLAAIATPFVLQAQTSLAIRGKIIDSETKDPLPAFVHLEGTDVGRSANYDGSFVLDISGLESRKTWKLSVFLIGYKKKIIEVKPDENITIELELKPHDAHEITVAADAAVAETEVKNAVVMDKMEVYTIPGTAADPIYASQVLPGINSFPDSSAILIRGGAPEEVAYFFDGVEIEHPFLSESLHESYFSIFDNQIINGFSVSSSGFHPKFGDALSGIMNIRAKDGMFQTEGGLGLSILGINSYIGLPIRSEGSFVGSYNAGQSDLMTRINGRDDSWFRTQNGFAKLKINLHKAHTLRILGLLDTYDFTQTSGFTTDSDNYIGGISLTSTLQKKLVSRFTLSRAAHRSSFDMESVFNKSFSDDVLQARLNFSLDMNSHFIEFGADIQHRDINVGFIEHEGDKTEFRVKGTRLGLFVNDRFRVTDRLYLDIGAGLFELRDSDNSVSFDPRASLAYFLTRKDVVRLAAGRYSQFGDYFTLAENPGLAPKQATHMSFSYDRMARFLNIRLTVYNKEYRNLFLFSDSGAVTNEGRGYARGAEIFVKWSPMYLDALFVYNFLNSKRKENDVPVMARSPYEIDHSFTGILSIKFRIATLGIRYSFATGLPITPLMGREWDGSSGGYTPIWGEPYSQRLPSYQRLDINGSINIFLANRMIILYVGITNILNHKNILRHEYSADYSLRNNQYSIFGRSIFLGVYLPFF
jgi:hypothetical protein